MNNPTDARKSSSDKPAFLKVSETVNLRYQKSGNGPPLILLHTIRTQIEYFRALAPRVPRPSCDDRTPRKKRTSPPPCAHTWGKRPCPAPPRAR